jgi:outer membrane biosynthesis protein TonB
MAFRTSTKQDVLRIGTGLGILAGVAIGLTVPALTAASEPPALPPCPTEDSDNCYWDATIRGYGQGSSFVTIDGVTTLIETEPTTEPTSEPEPPQPTETPTVVPEPAPAPVEPEPQPVAPQPVAPQPTDWRATFEADGHDVGDVIICTPPLTVATDTYPDGTTWASCQ